MYKTRSASYQELLDLAKLPTLYYRRLQDIATFMFKVKHSLVPVNISDLFNLKNTQYNLRNSELELPRFETLDLVGIQQNIWDLSFEETPKNDRNAELV